VRDASEIAISSRYAATERQRAKGVQNAHAHELRGCACSPGACARLVRGRHRCRYCGSREGPPASVRDASEIAVSSPHVATERHGEMRPQNAHAHELSGCVRSPDACARPVRYSHRCGRRGSREGPPVRETRARLRCHCLTERVEWAEWSMVGIRNECMNTHTSRPRVLTCSAGSGMVMNPTIPPPSVPRAAACVHARYDPRCVIRSGHGTYSHRTRESAKSLNARACAHLRRRLRPGDGSDDPGCGDGGGRDGGGGGGGSSCGSDGAGCCPRTHRNTRRPRTRGLHGKCSCSNVRSGNGRGGGRDGGGRDERVTERTESLCARCERDCVATERHMDTNAHASRVRGRDERGNVPWLRERRRVQRRRVRRRRVRRRRRRRRRWWCAMHTAMALLQRLPACTERNRSRTRIDNVRESVGARER
jgi:hypothetical protein